jgi:hypothetical protein
MMSPLARPVAAEGGLATMTPMPHPLLIELRDTFATRFARDELADLALDLGIDYEDLGGGESRSAKARALAQYIDRHQLLARLLEVGPRRRADIPWREMAVRHGVVVAEGTAPAALSGPELGPVVSILAGRPMFTTPDGRRALLVLAGVESLIAPDLNGSAQTVSAAVVTGLNAYGRTADGDQALARLIRYLLADNTLPPDQAAALAGILPQLT